MLEEQQNNMLQFI